MDSIVSYNVKAARERRGMTPEDLAEGLARLTGHRLPQALISAMERASTAPAGAICSPGPTGKKTSPAPG